MIDKVKPLKIETGVDFGPTETDPTQDYLACKGIVFEDDDDTYIDSLNGNISCITNGIVRLVIRSDGKIGIGINNPTSRLELIGVSNQAQFSINANSTQTRNIEEWRDSTGTALSAIGPNGDLITETIGVGVKIKEGTNGRMGQDTLVAGTITVSNTSITANTRIFLSVNTAGGTQGFLATTRVVSTSFTINSTNALDTSIINWLLIEPT